MRGWCAKRERPSILNVKLDAATHKDALAYIARLEAELTATRSELEREGDLCSICKHNKQDREQCIGCLECTNEECACYKCLKAATEEGYEWDGGEA